MKALIDGDVIVYQGGFASDQTSYVAPDGYECRYMHDMKNYCRGKDLDHKTVTKKVTAEPVEYCLNSIKKMINGIKTAIGADDELVLLTGKGNFREKIYTNYKANRDRTHRPIHYDAIREYLIKYWLADEVIGVEADDAMGWWQWKDFVLTEGDELNGESCICTIDKDLNQIPGWHYNWRADDGEGSMYWITPAAANRYFFEQWLTGDAADNIPGIHRVGEKTARAMLSNEFGPFDASALEYYNFVKRQYEASMPHIGAKFMHIIGDLLWMQRHPGETWDAYLGLGAERKTNESL